MEKLSFPKATLADIVRWRAQHQPQRNAFTFLLDGETQEERWSYADVDLRARPFRLPSNRCCQLANAPY